MGQQCATIVLYTCATRQRSVGVCGRTEEHTPGPGGGGGYSTTHPVAPRFPVSGAIDGKGMRGRRRGCSKELGRGAGTVAGLSEGKMTSVGVSRNTGSKPEVNRGSQNKNDHGFPQGPGHNLRFYTCGGPGKGWGWREGGLGGGGAGGQAAELTVRVTVDWPLTNLVRNTRFALLNIPAGGGGIGRPGHPAQSQSFLFEGAGDDDEAPSCAAHPP